MHGNDPEHTDIFIVRVWNNGLAGTKLTWRACVEHMPSRQRQYFSSPVDLSDFFRLRLSREDARRQG